MRRRNGRGSLRLDQRVRLLLTLLLTQSTAPAYAADAGPYVITEHILRVALTEMNVNVSADPLSGLTGFMLTKNGYHDLVVSMTMSPRQRAMLYLHFIGHLLDPERNDRGLSAIYEVANRDTLFDEGRVLEVLEHHNADERAIRFVQAHILHLLPPISAFGQGIASVAADLVAYHQTAKFPTPTFDGEQNGLACRTDEQPRICTDRAAAHQDLGIGTSDVPMTLDRFTEWDEANAASAPRLSDQIAQLADHIGADASAVLQEIEELLLDNGPELEERHRAWTALDVDVEMGADMPNWHKALAQTDADVSPLTLVTRKALLRSDRAPSIDSDEYVELASQVRDLTERLREKSAALLQVAVNEQQARAKDEEIARHRRTVAALQQKVRAKSAMITDLRRRLGN